MDNETPENIETPVDSVEENVEQVDNEAAEQETINWKAQARKHEERAKANFEDAQKWREYLESQKSEDEKREEELARTRLELEELRSASIKKDIALEKAIPTTLLKYLTGTTREELEAQADELLSVIAESAKPNSKPNPEQGKPIGKTDADSLASWVEDNILRK